MKLLVIGGTRFIGRHLVAAALARGDEVTLFHRARSGQAPAGARQLIGDRQGDLAPLAQGRWDAVVDTCGYRPNDVARMADALRDRVGRYLFVSAVSVYASAAQPNDEHSSVATIDDVDTAVVDGRTYGPLKALCEAELRRRVDERALVLRPGLVVGPHDPTQRFTWWPARLARAAQDGQPVLAPGRPDDPIQWIDARDLADFMLLALDQSHGGVFNVASAPGAATMGGLLALCARAAGAAPRLVWRDMASLQALGLAPWSELPLALPDDDEHHHFMANDTRKALSAGLRIRPLAATVADTLDWWRRLPPDQQSFDKAGLAPERERAAISA